MARSPTASSGRGPTTAPSWCYRRWRSSGVCAGSSPPPRRHLVRYAGVFGPASKARANHRALVPPRGGEPPPAAATPSGSTRAARLPWAELLRRVFATDVLACPCRGRRSVVAVVVDSARARAVLAALGLPCTPATFAPARGPPQAEFWFDDAS